MKKLACAIVAMAMISCSSDYYAKRRSYMTEKDTEQGTVTFCGRGGGITSKLLQSLALEECNNTLLFCESKPSKRNNARNHVLCCTFRCED